MTNAPKNGTIPEPDPGSNSVSGRASWGGSIASAKPAPEGAREDLHRGAQVLQASTEGGSKPGQEEKQNEPRARRQRASRARQRPRQPPEKKRLHQPATRFNEDEYALIKSAAARCNLSVAGFLAHSALTAARDLDRTAAEIATEREVITDLFAAGAGSAGPAATSTRSPRPSTPVPTLPSSKRPSPLYGVPPTPRMKPRPG